MVGSKIVILVADDEDLVRNMIAAIVQSDGYHVLIASGAAEALDLSRRYNGHIDLLISDILMPGMNGIELAQLLSQERPKTKVLLMSGNTEQPIPRPFRFLAKPFTVEALHQTMAHLLPLTG